MSELRYGPVHPRHRPLGQPHAGRPRTDTCKDRREHIFALSRSAVFAGVVQQSQRQGPGSAAAQARQSLGHSGSQAGHAHDRHRRGVGDHPRAGRAPRRAHPRHSPHLCDETRSLNDQNRFISLLYNDKYTCHQPYTVAHFAIRKRIVSEFTPYSDVACPPLSVRIRSCHGAGLISAADGALEILFSMVLRRRSKCYRSSRPRSDASRHRSSGDERQPGLPAR